MDELKRLIGERLREIRSIMNEGHKLSSAQFADLVGESKFNISNYESGKANIPPRLLVALYERGYNPTYILTGTGSRFADNKNGIRLQQLIEGKSLQSNAEIISGIDFSSLSSDELMKQASELVARAGNIMDYVRTKPKESND